MGRNEEDLKAMLLAENDEFRKLHDEHRGCDEKLGNLTSKSFLSVAEQMEERRLKKRKLFLKDRMAAIQAQHHSEPV